MSEETQAKPASETPAPQDEIPNGGRMRRRTDMPVPQGSDPLKYEELPPPEGPQVTYMGNATKRILTPEDWKRVGVDDTDLQTYVWDRTNAKMLPKSDFSPKQLNYLRRDGKFKIDEE